MTGPRLTSARARVPIHRYRWQVQRHGYEVDAIGEHGKALYARQFHIPLFGHANGFAGNLATKVKRTGL